jgi:hypothetical protein
MLEILGAHPNIVGVKLTCGGIAKVARVRFRFAPEKFCALAGQSDWLLPAITVGGTGVITGLANIYPRVSISYKSTIYVQTLTKSSRSSHVWSSLASPLTTEPKKPKSLRLNSLLWNGDLQRVVSTALSGWLLGTWDIPRPAAIPVARTPNTPTPRSRLGLWILCDRLKPRRRVLRRGRNG